MIGFMDIYGYLSSDYSRNLMDDDDEAVKRIGSGFIWHLWRLNQLKDWNISITQHKCDKWYQMISNDGWVGNLMWVYGIKSISHVGCDVFSICVDCMDQWKLRVLGLLQDTNRDRIQTANMFTIYMFKFYRGSHDGLPWVSGNDQSIPVL